MRLWLSLRRVSFGPARTVAAIAIALGVGSLVYRLLHATDLSQSAALFIGIPSLMAFLAAFVAVRLHAESFVGITLKTITIGLLLAGPILGEGFICVLLAAPLFYTVGILIAVAFQGMRRFARSRRHASTLGLLVLPMLAFSLEGVLPALTLPRHETSVAERTLVASPEMVEAALSQSPHFDAPLEGLLGIGFPRPATASGRGLAVGDRRVVTFATRGGRQRDLVMEVAASGAGWVRFQPVSDATKIAEWLGWQSADVSWTDLGDGHTRVRWALTYERRLDPAWYFGPWEAVVTTLAADYLIQSAATPAHPSGDPLEGEHGVP
jgi:hypothetical protein